MLCSKPKIGSGMLNSDIIWLVLGSCLMFWLIDSEIVLCDSLLSIGQEFWHILEAY